MTNLSTVLFSNVVMCMVGKESNISSLCLHLFEVQMWQQISGQEMNATGGSATPGSNCVSLLGIPDTTISISATVYCGSGRSSCQRSYLYY